MTSNYTRGPWQVLELEPEKPYLRIRGQRLGSRYKVANVIAPDWQNVADFEIDETMANARLICAAPDLLEALEDCVKVMEAELYGLAVIQPELAAAKAALEQAKGKQ